MTTVEQLTETINEIKRNRAKYIELIDNPNAEYSAYLVAQNQKMLCESRISDLTIALNLAKEKEELVKSLIAFEPHVANMASLCDTPKAIVQFRKIITDNEPCTHQTEN